MFQFQIAVLRLKLTLITSSKFTFILKKTNSPLNAINLAGAFDMQGDGELSLLKSIAVEKKYSCNTECLFKCQWLRRDEERSTEETRFRANRSKTCSSHMITLLRQRTSLHCDLSHNERQVDTSSSWIVIGRRPVELLNQTRSSPPRLTAAESRPTVAQF